MRQLFLATIPGNEYRLPKEQQALLSSIVLRGVELKLIEYFNATTSLLYLENKYYLYRTTPVDDQGDAIAELFEGGIEELVEEAAGDYEEIDKEDILKFFSIPDNMLRY